MGKGQRIVYGRVLGDFYPGLYKRSPAGASEQAPRASISVQYFPLVSGIRHLAQQPNEALCVIVGAKHPVGDSQYLPNVTAFQGQSRR
jgi:hypothetical protein